MGPYQILRVITFVPPFKKKPVACFEGETFSYRLCSSIEKDHQVFFCWHLFCCCENSIPARKPKGQIFIYVFAQISFRVMCANQNLRDFIRTEWKIEERRKPSVCGDFRRLKVAEIRKCRCRAGFRILGSSKEIPRWSLEF